MVHVADGFVQGINGWTFLLLYSNHGFLMQKKDYQREIHRRSVNINRYQSEVMVCTLIVNTSNSLDTKESILSMCKLREMDLVDQDNAE